MLLDNCVCSVPPRKRSFHTQKNMKHWRWNTFGQFYLSTKILKKKFEDTNYHNANNEIRKWIPKASTCHVSLAKRLTVHNHVNLFNKRRINTHTSKIGAKSITLKYRRGHARFIHRIIPRLKRIAPNLLTFEKSKFGTRHQFGSTISQCPMPRTKVLPMSRAMTASSGRVDPGGWLDLGRVARLVAEIRRAAVVILHCPLDSRLVEVILGGPLRGVRGGGGGGGGGVGWVGVELVGVLHYIGRILFALPNCLPTKKLKDNRQGDNTQVPG